MTAKVLAPSRSQPLSIVGIATCTPSTNARAWLSAPHPYLPLIASSSSDRLVRIYSLTSFTLISTIAGGHKRSIRTCAWKPGAKGDTESTLATGSFDASAGIWKADNGRTHVARSALQNVGEDDQDFDNGDDAFRFAVVLEGHESEIKSIGWSCNGKYLATCGRDKSVWIWEALDDTPLAGAMNVGVDAGDDEDNYETVAVLQEHDGDVKCVAWHPSDETCLASSSYDNAVRIWREDADGEWSCVGIGEGHEGTVWSVAWEPEIVTARASVNADDESVSGPRLISCSDDLTVRLWRRKPKPKAKLPQGPKMPSIIRNSGDEEVWFEDGQLPKRHERAIYSVTWSKLSGLIATAGSDGKIVVYREQSNDERRTEARVLQDHLAFEGSGHDSSNRSSGWAMIAELEAAHGVFEINHITWAGRYDSSRKQDGEEVLITTGDDGEVKVWALKM